MATGLPTPGLSAKRRKELRAPDPLLARAMVAGEWLEARKKILIRGAIVLVVVSVATVVWTETSSKAQGHAARSLARALLVANAEVRSAEPDPEAEDAPGEAEPEDDRPVFKSVKSRAKASVHAFRRTLKAYADSPLAPVARLGEAAAHEDLGEMDQAKRLYQDVVRAEGLTPDLRAQAIDGLARCLETSGDLPGALRQLDALRTMEEGAFKDLAQYGRARIFQRQGKNVQARELLQKIQTDLGAEDAPERPYLRTQVEQRLRELEASTPSAEGPEGDGDEGGRRPPPRAKAKSR